MLLKVHLRNAVVEQVLQPSQTQSFGEGLAVEAVRCPGGVSVKPKPTSLMRCGVMV